MNLEKWIIHPGETRVIDVNGIRALKVGLVGGQIDVIAHDEPDVRIEVHSVSGKDLRIEVQDGTVDIDHAQLRWDNFLESFKNFGGNGPKAEISIAVPRATALTLGVVSASALVSGLHSTAKLNTVSGDLIIDGLTGDLSLNAVSGDTQARELIGTLNANSVSGDVAVTGSLRTASIDTMSGTMLIDSTGPIESISLNSVSGNATVRLDDGYPANVSLRTVSGRITVDGAVQSGAGGIGTSFTGALGELSGSFVDLRSHSVAGDTTIVRRTQPLGGE